MQSLKEAMVRSFCFHSDLVRVELDVEIHGVLFNDLVGLYLDGKDGQFFHCLPWEQLVLYWVLFLLRGSWIRKVSFSNQVLTYMGLGE